MKNREEIISILTENNSDRTCVYCNEPISRGYYAEDGIGKRLCLPKFLTKPFIENEAEILIHYRCVEQFIFDIIDEGGGTFGGTRENTRILIRY